MVLRIVKCGDPVLETPAKTVTEFETPELRETVDNMFETMYANKGIGLAAPQVNLPIRLTVIDPSAGEDPEKKVVLINPEIVAKEGKQIGEEGCLSVPGFREQVTRAMKIKVRGQNLKGEPIEVDAEELLARVLQHEIDHLNGVLFLSRLSMLKRDLIRRRIRKLQKAGEWQ